MFINCCMHVIHKKWRLAANQAAMTCVWSISDKPQLRGWVCMSEECVMLPLCWCGWQRQWSIELRDFPVDKRKQGFSQFSVVPLQLSMVFLLIWTDQRLVLPQSILTPESRTLKLVGSMHKRHRTLSPKKKGCPF